MKVAVSGASGFIGRHVVAALERRGLSPTLWVRPSSVVPEAWVRHPLVRLDHHRPAEQAFSLLGRPDVLIHLAWGGLPHYTSLHHFEEELPAHYRLLKQLVEQGLPHLVVAGTCFEYGPQSGPLSETLPARPDNPYGFAKDVLRQQLQFLQRHSSGGPAFTLTWARLFYLHGQGQPLHSLLPQLRRAVEAGDTLFPMSGGEQLRDYLNATEAADLLVQLALSQRNHGVVNLCSGKPVSVGRLVESWIEENGWRIRPEFGRFPYPAHEPMAFWGDDTRLRQCLQPR